jgi:hypothetical protein
VATHLKRYWDPRMRAQMLKYYEERAGAGLSEVAKSAVALLCEAGKAPAGAAPAAPAGAPSQPASPASGAKT